MTDIVICQECRHDTNLHFYEKSYPDVGFCQINGCSCTCGWLQEVDNSNGPT